MATEPLQIGPMDPRDGSDPTDRSVAGQFGADTVAAQKLLEYHAAMHPTELVVTGSMPKDEERSRALDLEEVKAAAVELAGLPEEAKVLGASVRGTPGRQRVLYLYEADDGRTHRWFVPYAGLDESRRAFARGEGAKDADEAESWEDRVRRLEEQLSEVKSQGKSDEEPMKGYDEMGAEEVVNKLSDSDDEQRRAVRKYEESHKARKTVLQAAEVPAGDRNDPGDSEPAPPGQ